MKRKLFVANYSRGDYDDYYEHSVFVSEEKELVEKWVEKFNSKLKIWKEYFNSFNQGKVSDESGWERVKDEFVDTKYERWYYIKHQNKAFISEIEIR